MKTRKKKPSEWTVEEENFLVENYPNGRLKVSEIAAFLKKSEQSLYNKALLLGLKRETDFIKAKNAEFAFVKIKPKIKREAIKPLTASEIDQRLDLLLDEMPNCTHSSEWTAKVKEFHALTIKAAHLAKEPIHGAAGKSDYTTR